VSPNDIVRDAPKKTTSMSWPWPVDELLDRLVDLAVLAGDSSGLSRGELLAALIHAAPREGRLLKDILEAYRLSRAGELLPTDKDVVPLHPHGPGRR
jgi:hypothetical protein